MTNEKQEEKKVMPAFKSKHGGVDGVVWANEKTGENGAFTSYSHYIDKSYTRDDGITWEKSKGFFSQDTENTIKVLNDIKAFYESVGARTSVKPFTKQ